MARATRSRRPRGKRPEGLHQKDLALSSAPGAAAIEFLLDQLTDLPFSMFLLTTQGCRCKRTWGMELRHHRAHPVSVLKKFPKKVHLVVLIQDRWRVRWTGFMKV